MLSPRQGIVFSGLAALVLGSCTRDAAAPALVRFDPAAVTASLGTLTAAFTAAPLQSLQALSGRVAAATAPGMLHSLASVPSLPVDVRGTTFVIDSTTGLYVPDPSREGAPADGVRFILYAVNGVTGQPLLEREIGYADISDEGESFPPGGALRLRVVSGDSTYLDYHVATARTDSTMFLTATGSTRAGPSAVSFRMATAGACYVAGSASQLQFEIGIPDRAFHVTATARNVEGASGSAGHVGVGIDLADAHLAWTAEGSPHHISGAFSVNGALLATVTGDPRAPALRGADSQPLDDGERRALEGIMRLTAQAFSMFEALMQPVAGLLGAGAA